jgi:hypothetical protein
MALDFFSTKEVEWNDLSVYVSGVLCGKVEDFEVGVKQKTEYLHAAGQEPISIQRGNKEYPFKLTLLKGAVDNMWDAAVQAGGDDVTDIVFDITGSFRAYGARTLSRYSATGCVISESMFKLAQNDTSMKVELPGLAMGLAKL